MWPVSGSTSNQFSVARNRPGLQKRPAAIDHGYHPIVRAQGHEGYIFTILVGHPQRSLVQFFEPPHRHLMAKIPGLQAMRDKFK